MLGRKKQKLFGSEIEPKCEYCIHLPEDPDTSCRFGSNCLSCGHFRYDPLKRTPVCPPPLKKHSPDEFSL